MFACSSFGLSRRAAANWPLQGATMAGLSELGFLPAPGHAAVQQQKNGVIPEWFEKLFLPGREDRSKKKEGKTHKEKVKMPIKSAWFAQENRRKKDRSVQKKSRNELFIVPIS